METWVDATNRGHAVTCFCKLIVAEGSILDRRELAQATSKHQQAIAQSPLQRNSISSKH
jgi:hypothetical protein